MTVIETRVRRLEKRTRIAFNSIAFLMGVVFYQQTSSWWWMIFALFFGIILVISFIWYLLTESLDDFVTKHKKLEVIA